MATYNLFINSKNREASDQSCDYTLMLKNQIMVKKNEYINVNVMSFYMLNSMYNVSTILKNNTYDIEKRTLAGVFVNNTTYIIPDGNYSVLTLRELLNAQLSGIASISYNFASNTYTFVRTDSTYRYIIKNIKCSQLIGVNTDTEITSFTGTYCNMVNYQQVILKTDLQHESLNQDTISDTKNDLNISQILFWTNKQDVEPFQAISYTNNGGNCYSYNITNDNISSLHFTLCNERNELISDAPEYMIHIQFVVREKQEYSNYQLAKKMIGLMAENNHMILTNILKKYLSLN
jgi:hypothetical protein